MPSPGGADSKEARVPAELLVPEDGAFVRRDRATGEVLGRSGADVPAGGSAARVGPVVVLRLPDRVLAYR
jgi:hypothetical protein